MRSSTAAAFTHVGRQNVLSHHSRQRNEGQAHHSQDKSNSVPCHCNQASETALVKSHFTCKPVSAQDQDTGNQQPETELPSPADEL